MNDQYRVATDTSFGQWAPPIACALAAAVDAALRLGTCDDDAAAALRAYPGETTKPAKTALVQKALAVLTPVQQVTLRHPS